MLPLRSSHHQKTELVEDDGHAYLASTEFRLADGTILRAFTSPTEASGRDYVQPVIFHDGRQLSLWSDDRFDYGEQRFVSFGTLEGRVVAVVHTETCIIALTVLRVRLVRGKGDELRENYI